MMYLRSKIFTETLDEQDYYLISRQVSITAEDRKTVPLNYPFTIEYNAVPKQHKNKM